MKWSEFDLALLKSAYSGGGVRAVVAAFPGRTPSSVRSRLYFTGITGKMNYRPTCNCCGQEFKTDCRDIHSCPKCTVRKSRIGEINGVAPAGGLVDLRD